MNNKYYIRATIYIRAINIEGDGEQYGTYYQAVRSFREGGKVKQEVVHFGEHQSAEGTLSAWPREIQELERRGKPPLLQVSFPALLSSARQGAGIIGAQQLP